MNRRLSNWICDKEGNKNIPIVFLAAPMYLESSCLVSVKSDMPVLGSTKRLLARLCLPSKSNIFKIEPAFDFQAH